MCRFMIMGVTVVELRLQPEGEAEEEEEEEEMRRIAILYFCSYLTPDNDNYHHFLIRVALLPTHSVSILRCEMKCKVKVKTQYMVDAE